MLDGQSGQVGEQERLMDICVTKHVWLLRNIRSYWGVSHMHHKGVGHIIEIDIGKLCVHIEW